MSNQIVDGVVDIIVDHVSKRYLFKMFRMKPKMVVRGSGSDDVKRCIFFYIGTVLSGSGYAFIIFVRLPPAATSNRNLPKKCESQELSSSP